MEPAIVISIIFGVSGVLGVAYGVFKTSAKTSTVELYAKENEVLGKALARSETELTRIQTKAEALANANAVLQETVSGTAAVKGLAEEIRREEAARREEHQVHLVLLKDLLAQIKNKRGEIGR